MRFARSVTSVSWIPSEAMTGPMCVTRDWESATTTSLRPTRRSPPVIAEKRDPNRTEVPPG
jgi:hypothetical protein